MEKIMDKIKEVAESIQDSLVSHRRYLHEHPETDMDLENTQKYVMDALRGMGYDPKPCGGSGVVALAGGKKPGKVFLIRGDMDALPISEESDLGYASRNGNMHACGHDMHTTMMLGAAKILKEVEHEIEGSVKLMFQPGEETLKGAKAMIEDGLLDEPRVDAGMMIHVASGIPLESGTIIAPNVGVASSASDWFEINIQGKGGHGAVPDSTIDPINIAAHTHLSLQAINSRELPTHSKVALTVGRLSSGDTFNVIPDKAILQGTIRTYNKEDREFIPRRIKEISKGVATTFRGDVDVNIIEGCPSVINDEGILKSAQNAVEASFSEKIVNLKDLGTDGTMGGSEDFGFLSEKIPTLMLFLAAGNSEDGHTYPTHHPKVTFDESVLNKGSATYASIALNWLRENK